MILMNEFFLKLQIMRYDEKISHFYDCHTKIMPVVDQIVRNLK